MPDKARERFYLEALRRALPDLPPGHALEPEPPDFLLETNGERLGIEFTHFHLPPPLGQRPHQERQSLKDRIVEIAEQLHHTAGGPALYVGVFFNENVPLSKGDTQRLAHAIADSVLNAPLPQSIYEPVNIAWGRRPPETVGIQLHASIDGEDKLWHADAGGMVAAITPAHINGVLLAKARMASLARSRCDRLWLVVVNDMFSRAAPAEIQDAALAEVYEAPFDRLIWLEPQPPRAIDLRLRPPAA